jgi:hypothetical protein
VFGVNWSDPETLWLNLTNLGLGICVLACFGVFAYGALQEVRERLRRRADISHLDRDVAGLMHGAFDAHVLSTPQLGLTMADGGEPVVKQEAKPAAKRVRKPKSAGPAKS